MTHEVNDSSMKKHQGGLVIDQLRPDSKFVSWLVSTVLEIYFPHIGYFRDCLKIS